MTSKNVQQVATAPLDTLERIDPETAPSETALQRRTLEVHLERYQYARRFAQGCRVLDIACGVGYGAATLAEATDSSIVGVDISSQAVDHARRHYKRRNLRFLCADAMDFQAGEPFDLVISFETIEHLPKPKEFLHHIVSLVKPGGFLISSVPTTPSVDVNPHHLHDFTRRSFRNLVQGAGLSIDQEWIQRQEFSLRDLSRERKMNSRLGNLRPALPLYYLSHPGAALRRIAATVRHGLSNEYLILVGRHPGERRGVRASVASTRPATSAPPGPDHS